MFEAVKPLTILAMSHLLKFWGKNHDIKYKEDCSPVTEVDIWMSNFLKCELKKIENIKVISEEDIKQKLNKKINRYWLIDPLDGTKEFIKGEKDFAVNIALIDNQNPVFGCIIAPMFDQIFYAERNKGAFCIKNNVTKKITIKKNVKKITFISNSNTNPLDKKFLIENNIKITKRIGASLKFCKLAMGEGAIYARFDKLHSWDVAAGHLFVKEAGYRIFDLITREEPLYLDPQKRLSPFIVLHPNYQLQEMRLPCLVQ